MKYLMSIMAVLIMFSATESSAQNEQVRLSLKMVALGQTQEVKLQLLDLLAQYPDDPGVMLLHGVVIRDAERALEKYKTIVANYPNSEWADDASWRIVQFYAIAADTIMAKRELKNYRNNYPTSQFLSPAADVVRLAISRARLNSGSTPVMRIIPNTEPAPVLTEIPIEAKGMTVSPQTPPVITVSESIPVIKPITRKPITQKPVVNRTSLNVSATAAEAEESDDDEIIEVVEIGEDEDEIVAEIKEAEVKPVPVEEIAIIEGTPAKIISAPENAKYGLQVGIYSTYEAAKFEQEKFRSQRMLAVVEQKVVDGETMYAVVIGDYSSKESAETAKVVVQQQCKCLPIVFVK